MIDDCRAEKVLLEKELKVLTDYIALEKVRYGEGLDIQIDVKGDYKNVMITPLLMIPFVENSFKHGASKILKHPWIKLIIHIEGKHL
jgi:LytS/YehU family sensor histidine kinase